MYRVYLGNLDQNVTEETLQGLFADHGFEVSGILVKRGYGFVDCLDQNTFDKAIDQLNGYSLLGSVMQVEPSTISKRRKSNRIQIRNLPTPIVKEEIEKLVASMGTVQRCDIVSGSLENYVTVVYEMPDDAQKAVEQLNNYEFEGCVLRVEFTNNREGRSSRNPNNRSNNGQSRSQSVYVLRMLVPSEYVGAIIGKKGQTIRTITSDCKVSRIDVHGKENGGLVEKAIFIAGQPDSVTLACKEILKIMQQESTSNNRGDVVLKIMADDRYCGRVIGKEGKIIKKIREDTDTKIVVSSSDDLTMIYPDRIITVRGTVDSMSQAEEAISLILRECLDRDFQHGGGMPPDIMLGNSRSNSAFGGMGGYSGQRPSYGGGGGLNQVGMYPPHHRSGSHGGVQNNVGGSVGSDAYYISVPNTAVGAIIGSGGSNIKQIIRDSSAYVTIEPKKDADSNPAVERSVTIKGNPDAFWRASYFIFEKMKLEGFAGNDDVRLRTLMTIPKSVVGRVIGKGGKNARDVEQMTGAIIRITEDPRAQDDEAMVEVFGNFTATQGALSRIRNTISLQSKQPHSSASPPHDRGDPPTALQ